MTAQEGVFYDREMRAYRLVKTGQILASKRQRLLCDTKEKFRKMLARAAHEKGIEIPC